MLTGDAVRIKQALKSKAYGTLSAKDWDVVRGMHRDLFTKKETFADTETGRLREREYIDHDSFSQDETISILKKNRRI